VKKKDSSSSSERISAMLLGGSLCSSDNGKYKGPLFARKRNRSFGKFFLVLFLITMIISAWELGRRYVPEFAHNVSTNFRGLASEYLPGNTKAPKKEAKVK
jgi:hypothetical protein